MKTQLIRALLVFGVLSGLTTGRSVQANPVAVGPASEIIVTAIAETATGLVVSESLDTLRRKLAGPPAIPALSLGEISVGLHAYDEYNMFRDRHWRVRYIRTVIPNPATGALGYHFTAVTIDTNTLAVQSRVEDNVPFAFRFRDLHETCGSASTVTERSRSITTRLAVKHRFDKAPVKPPATFIFNLLVAHTAEGVDPTCPGTTPPIPDGAIWVPAWVTPRGHRVLSLPRFIYPNIVTQLGIDRVGSVGGTTVSI